MVSATDLSLRSPLTFIKPGGAIGLGRGNGAEPPYSTLRRSCKLFRDIPTLDKKVCLPPPFASYYEKGKPVV
jgi:hypothetical protein